LLERARGSAASLPSIPAVLVLAVVSDRPDVREALRGLLRSGTTSSWYAVHGLAYSPPSVARELMTESLSRRPLPDPPVLAAAMDLLAVTGDESAIRLLEQLRDRAPADAQWRAAVEERSTLLRVIASLPATAQGERRRGELLFLRARYENTGVRVYEQHVDAVVGCMGELAIRVPDEVLLSKLPDPKEQYTPADAGPIDPALLAVHLLGTQRVHAAVPTLLGLTAPGLAQPARVAVVRIGAEDAIVRLIERDGADAFADAVARAGDERTEGVLLRMAARGDRSSAVQAAIRNALARLRERLREEQRSPAEGDPPERRRSRPPAP